MKSTLLALSASILLSACATPSYISGKKGEQYANKFGLSSDTLASLKLSNSDAGFVPGDTVLALAAGQSDSGKRAATIIAMISASDAACEDYMAGVVASSNSIISTLGITTLGLTSAAAVTSPTRSANLLSGIASFTGGSEKELSDTVLAGNSPQLIYKAVKAVRKKERSRLINLLSQNDIGFALAAVDMADYHAQCGPTIGVNALEEAVSIADQNAIADGVEAAQNEADKIPEVVKSKGIF